MGKRANDDPNLLAEIKSLYDSGRSISWIRDHFGFSHKKATNIIRRSGAKFRTRKEAAPRGADNHQWKGDEASYGSLHARVYRALGKASHCEMCGTRSALSYHYACIDGDYTNISSYMPLCQSCHFKLDKVGLRSNAVRLSGIPSPKDEQFRCIVDREYAAKVWGIYDCADIETGRSAVK